MSEEGGLEELPEFFLSCPSSWTILASSPAIFSSAALSSASSPAIRLSLESIGEFYQFVPVDSRPNLVEHSGIP